MIEDLTDKDPVLVITRGLPASGKTTWAKQQVLTRQGLAVRVNRDDLRRMMFVRQDYSRHQESRVTVAQHAMVTELLRTGSTVICDDTNLDLARVATLRAFAAANHARFHVVDDFLRVPLAECIQRDSFRDPAEQVGEEVILSMWQRHLANPGKAG